MVKTLFITKILQKKFRSEFSESSLKIGSELFNLDKVLSLKVSDHLATAEVSEGAVSFNPRIAWADAGHIGVLGSDCQCEAAKTGFCGHIWSLILELDKKGISLKIPFRKNNRFLKMKDFTDLFGEDVLEMVDSDLATQVEKSKNNQLLKVKDWKSVDIDLEKDFPGSHLTTFAEAFVVLNPDPLQSDAIKLKFFQVEDTGFGPKIRPLILLHDRMRKIANPQFDQLVTVIMNLSLNDKSMTEGHVRAVKISALQFILKPLLETKNVYASTEDYMIYRETHEPKHLEPLNLKDFVVHAQESQNGLNLVGALVSDLGENIPIAEVKKIGEPGFFYYSNQIGFLSLSEEQLAWFNESSQGIVSVSAEEQESFLEYALNSQCQFEVPNHLKWETIEVDPLPKYRLVLEKSQQSEEDKKNSRFAIELSFQYGERSIKYTDSRKFLPWQPKRIVYKRNSLAETQWASKVDVSGFSNKSVNGKLVPVIRESQVFQFIKTSLEAGIPVDVDSRKATKSSRLKLAVSSGIDWFEVSGEVEFDGHWVKIPTVLEAISKGESFVPLADGGMGVIDEEIIEKLARLTHFSELKNNTIRFNKSQALLLNSLLESEEEVSLDSYFEEIRSKLKEFDGIKSLKAPNGFLGELRSYQCEGLGWLKFLEGFGLGGVLADDMGLGKTIQCLAFLQDRMIKYSDKGQPSLLVAPKSLLMNWVSEIKKFTPDISSHIHAGNDRTGDFKELARHQLVITTYQTLLRDLEQMKLIQWDCVILDEAQNIKSPSALISKAVKSLTAEFRLAMTGTPIENSIQDLFSISDFVNPGFLTGRKRGLATQLTQDDRKALARAFKPIILRRTKDQVLKDLPAKIEQYITVELEEGQLKAYEELKRYYQSQLMNEVKEVGVNRSQMKILSALTRLRQAALHPGLIDQNLAVEKSAKFEAMLEMLEEVIAENHRVLIFSQFTSLLALLKPEIEKRQIPYSYLDGQTQNRQEVIEEFKSKNHPVFLMSLKAGGVGLNLVEADYVFLLDPWWNPAVESQAIDRAHRIGQTRPVHAYRFIAKDTVEEKILELQKTKKDIAADLFDEKTSLIKNLSASDIEDLFN